MKLALIFFTLATPLLHAQTSATPPASPPLPPPEKPLAFTIVSIHPHNPNAGGGGYHVAPDCHKITVSNLTLSFLISNAYNLKDGRFLIGGPSWINTTRFDLEAKLEETDIPPKTFPEDRCLALLQPVLADRFQLRVHHESRPMLVYNLVLAKGGLRMKESVPPAASAKSAPCNIDAGRRGSAIGRSCPMSMIVAAIEDGPGRYVVDQTGLTGRYDFELHWAPDNTPADSPLAASPSIFTAVEEQLGLKLEPATAPLDTLVIDSAEKPSEN